MVPSAHGPEPIGTPAGNARVGGHAACDRRARDVPPPLLVEPARAYLPFGMVMRAAAINPWGAPNGQFWGSFPER
jgi:hypothetical protein